MIQTALHEGWRFVQTDLEGKKSGFSQIPWLPAQVPGHVHLDLQANGVIPDPFQGMHEMGLEWIDRTDWTYETTFVHADSGMARQVLRFEGLDTLATVLLNGEVVGESENMFVPVEFDVTGRLLDGENVLRILFRSSVNVGEVRRDAYLAKEGLDPANLERFDERSFVRKAQYMYGWDWGPRLVSCGIWKTVSLLEFDARILDVHVTSEEGEDGWTVSVKTEIEGEGELAHDFDGLAEDEEGFPPFREGDGEIFVPYGSAGRWSPDSPVAFVVQTALVGDEGVELDERATTAGLGTVRLLRERDEIGESFEFEVNGEPLWVRGANWIPDHSFPALVDRARLRDRLTKAKDLGFNMLRVWGGGLYESDDFYDLCDELGILVWQDFPFACAYYPDDQPFRAVITAEATTAVKRLRNHPCLALWCGNNENHEMFYNRWGGDKTPPRYYGSPLYDETLPAVLAELDPVRAYIPSSPIGSPENETVTDAKRKGPNADGWGDQHNWDVWHGRGDWKHYTESEARFQSEYGFASSPSLALWKETLGDVEGLTARSPSVVWHDKTGKGTETFIGYAELHYPPAGNLADWVYSSQLNQRDALRHGVEHYRRSTFCKGSLIWQFNDCWPVQSWAVMDSAGDLKALGYELRRLYADGLLSLVKDGSVFTLWAINDGREPWHASFDLFAQGLGTPEILKESEGEFVLEPGERRVVGTLDIAGLPAPETLVLAGAEGALGTWRVAEEPKNMRLPAPAPITVSMATEGYLEYRCDTPLVDLMLTDAAGSPGAFMDDFVTSPTGYGFLRLAGTPVGVRARSLAGVHEVRMVRGPL